MIITSKWDAQQKRAIRSAIRHWYRNLMILQLNKFAGYHHLEDLYIFSNKCALCKLYIKDQCIKCPLSVVGDRCIKPSSTWTKMRKEVLWTFVPHKDKIASIGSMINKLESLLD